jgi:hypothetical protein
MVMIGGIMRLIVVTGGVRKLVQFLSEKNDFVTNKKSQLLAMVVTSLIFIESSINQLIAGASTKILPDAIKSRRKRCPTLSRPPAFRLLVGDDQRLGAAMMGVIGVQIAQGYLTGEPFEVLAARWSGMSWPGFH